LACCERVRAAGAVAMGLAATPEEATARRPATPKIALVAPPADYVASDGRPILAGDIDLTARMLSMAKMHHALPGTGGVAFAVAGVLPGTLAARLRGGAAGGQSLRLGHPSGILPVGAEAACCDGRWQVTKVVMSRSARRLMEGFVRVPRPSNL
jgi:2-methylaconitate cis-trans-isomerase PrpF